MKAMEPGAPMISVPAGVLKEFMTTSNSRTPTPPTLSTTPITNTITNDSTNNSADKSSPLNTPPCTPASTPTPTPASTPTPTPTPALANSRTSSPAPIPASIDTSAVTITPAKKLEALLNGKILDEDSKTDSEDKDSEEKENENKEIKENGTEMNGVESDSTSMNGIEESRPNSSMNGEAEPKPKKDETKDESDEKQDEKPEEKAEKSKEDSEMKPDENETKPSEENETAKKEETKDESEDKDSVTVVNGNTGSGVKRSSEEDDGPLKPDLKKIRVFPSNSDEAMKREMRLKEFNQTTASQNSPDGSSAPQTTTTTTTTTTPTKMNPVPIAPKPTSDSATPQQQTPTQLSKERPFAERDLNLRKNIRRLTRKELESVVIRQFSEKLLYEWEMGRMKQMCEKLETTLENNRKKTAQFHKEIEDLRKVTNRLSAEHISRKGQYVAPIRIKRSVGIQAAPHIINKGIMHANGNNTSIKTIAPRASAVPPPTSMVGVMNTSNSQSLLPSGTLGIITTAQHGGIRAGPGVASSAALQGVRSAQGQIMMMAPANTTVQNLTAPNSRLQHPGVSGSLVQMPQNRVVRPQMATLGTVMASGGTALLGQRPILHLQDKSGLHPAAAPKNSSGVIDLTDEDDANRGRIVPKPGTLVKVPASGTAQLVPLQQAGGVAGQVVLLNNSSGGQPTTALLVSQVSTGMQSLSNVSSPAVAQARITSSVPVSRHPAQLPRTPIQQMGGSSKMLPPQPTLKLSHKDSSIVLSWTMSKTEDHETIASYQLYAYQEGTSPPSPTLWKKVGSVKALELPMACTLTQFMPGHVYHFAVRAVDIKSRLGPFSDPKSIKLDKK